MYAETEPMYPYLQELGFNFTLGEDYHHLQVRLQEEEELLHRLYEQNHLCIGNSLVDGQYYHYNNLEYLSVNTSLLSNTGRTPCVPPEYEFGEEGDLFKAPEPIVEPEDASPTSDQHQLPAATCLIPRAETMGNDLLGDGEMEFMGKIAIEEAFPELADVKFPTLDMGEDQVEGLAVGGSPMQKSVSCGCLSGNEGSQMPSTVDFQAVDASAFGLRRAYSEGDIETLGNGDAAAAVTKASVVRPAYERLRNADDAKMAERRQKLSRYRKKKTKRNFDRKIKYACRKALADNQPRVRGRFARTGGCEVGKTTN